MQEGFAPSSPALRKYWRNLPPPAAMPEATGFVQTTAVCTAAV